MRNLTGYAAALAASLLPSAAVAAAAPRGAPLLFVYRGGGCIGQKRMPAFEQFLGRRPDGVVGFNDMTSWDHMLQTARWSAGCWRNQPYRLATSVPMLVRGTNLEAGARGEYDQYFRQLGEILVRSGHGDAFVRIGWEFNGGWYPWRAAGHTDAWISYFRRIAKIFRSVPGSSFQIVWNPARGVGTVAPDKLYPGDDVVDVIGLDLYNASDNPLDRIPAIGWHSNLTRPYSLNWLAEFGKAHGKPIAIPELGTGKRPDGRGLGDDPQFITNMARWMRDNHVLFHGYWDYSAKDFDAAISTGKQPGSAAAFRQAFGTRN